MLNNIKAAIYATVVAMALGIFASIGAAQAAVTTYINNTPIMISDTTGVVNPFPSVINVSGSVGGVTDVNVILNGVTHTWGGDIEVLLEGPGGAQVLLIESTLTSTQYTNNFITFSDDGAAFTKGVTGTFAPTGGTCAGTACVAPGALLSAYNGVDPNGDWLLHVTDTFGPVDGGTIAGGWSLEVATVPIPAALPLFLSGLAAFGFVVRRKRLQGSPVAAGVY